MKRTNLLQLFPIFLAVLTFVCLSIFLILFIHFLNVFPLQNKIHVSINPLDIIVGFTIYIKTAIDFALFIGNVMHKHPGIKNRISIELGTALGNGIGTLVILTIWVFFKEVPVLLILMMLLASLVLLRMAEDGFHEYDLSTIPYKRLRELLTFFATSLLLINSFFDSILGKILPTHMQQKNSHQTFMSLFFFSLSIPFLLGLDDFAGYISLFSVINVVGFAIGVFLGHMFLTAALFAFPEKTTRFVKQPVIVIFGSFVFLGLSLWGFVEVGISLSSLIGHLQ